MAGTNDRLYVVRSGASATASVAVATVAATAKTVIACLGSASDSIALKRVRISFASVTATDVPALVEVGFTTTLGTGTAFTPVQMVGHSLPSSVAAAYNLTAEPTYLRIWEVTHIPVNNGLMEWWYPLGEEPQCDANQGIAIRITSPQAQSVLASMLFSE